MKKYYWVLFRVVRHSWNAEGMSKGTQELHVEELSEVHPIQLTHERNEKYGKQHEDAPPVGHTAREHYGLLNWKELSKDEYEQFKDIV